MPFTTGTATDYKDLLDALRVYLAAQGWTVNRWTPGASLTDISELAVEGPGSVGGQPVNISISTANDTGLNAYAWRVCGHRTFDSAIAFGLQPDNGPLHYFLLWPNAIDYWFYVNDRRFIVIAKIGVVYISLYAGFFLPFALPTEYPYPFYVGATSNVLDVYTVNDARYRSFVDPGAGGASYFRREGMDWASFTNHNPAALVADKPVANDCVTWPYRVPGTDDGGFLTDQSWGWLNLQRPNLAGKMPMFQVMLVDHAERYLPGMLDGVYATSGFNRVPEQVITHLGVDYRLFINMARTRPKDFFAIEEA